MNFKKLFFLYLPLIISSSLFFSCGKKKANISDFSSTKWKSDKNGCENIRQDLVPLLIEQRDKLKGLSFNDVIDLLGMPDGNELSKREEKFYLYFINASPACDSYIEAEKTLTLKIRFSFRGIVKELSLENRIIPN